MDTSVFISYAHETGDFALQLAHKLNDAGVTYWLDRHMIATGDDWDREIDRALDNCTHFVIVLSPPAAASDEVRSELRVALNTNKIIIPVHLTNRPIDYLTIRPLLRQL